MRKTIAIVILLITSGVFSGCSTLETANTTTTGTEDGPVDGHVRFGDIEAYYANESGFYYRGTVRFKAPPNQSLKPTTFHDVTLCLYGLNGTVLNSTIVGDFETPTDHETVSIRSQSIPKYIVIDHPRFRTYGQIYQNVGVWQNESQVYAYTVGPLEELDPPFPYPRHNETGKCM
ncbi:membrane lipoprotein [Halorhabdus tiamatea SARL4B]|uniref:Membrane lipoprotein n=1 Tax=Halorhabdus tiamatea SARL4B TaxID=1033806 RepID=U2FD34_9EURY|nr:hypothetical protein [Halorhabdus tiamatea]ERJ06259.1 membrane lipoprotein [Halorhabdus tiamatea SARL4B]